MVQSISNAIKFSSLRERAVIEVSSLQEGENIIYFVRDNGVGFDMRYAGNSLQFFGVCHSEKEFEVRA